MMMHGLANPKCVQSSPKVAEQNFVNNSCLSHASYTFYPSHLA